MLSIDQAIEAIQRIPNAASDELTSETTEEALNIAIQALIKMMPHRPILRVRTKEGMEIRQCLCPVCNAIMDGDYLNFCDNCGNFMSWTDYKEKNENEV